MTELQQNYKDHARWLPAYHFFVIPVLLANVLNAVRHVYLYPVRSTVFALIVAVALMMLGLLSRTMTLTVQDRLIRLEMRLRLRESLPVELRARIGDLTPKQLVALRFAGDDEMADLVREVLGGGLQTGKDIKLRVKNWQPDFLRA
jgi:hypothetical protein